MTEAPAPVRRLQTLADIKAGIEELALYGDGAQKTQAFRLLLSMGQADSALPDPLSDHELIERLVRLHRGAGVRLVRLAYLRAFPKRQTIEETLAVMGEKDVDIRLPREKWPKTLRALYKHCPELKQSGYPKTFPIEKGRMACIEWCEKQFIQYHVTKAKERKRVALVDLDMDNEGTDADNARTDSRTADRPPGEPLRDGSDAPEGAGGQGSGQATPA